MSQDALAGFDERLKQRRIAFVEKTLTGWSDIEGCSSRFAANSADTEALEVLTRFFHKLAGAAGIYELVDICDLAVEAESFCLKIEAVKLNPAGIAGYLARINEAFQKIRYL